MPPDPQQDPVANLPNPVARVIEKFSRVITRWMGSSVAFCLALIAVIVWLLSRPLFTNEVTWLLIINTGGTVITFLMVFLIQRSQNRESLSVQLKLNEIVAALEGASNRLVNVESLTESELKAFQQHYDRLVAMTRHEVDFAKSHSIEEARTEDHSPDPSPTPGSSP